MWLEKKKDTGEKEEVAAFFRKGHSVPNNEKKLET